MLTIQNSEILTDLKIPDANYVILYTGLLAGHPLIFKVECYGTETTFSCPVHLN